MKATMETDFTALIKDFENQSEYAVQAAKEALEETADLVAEKTKKAMRTSRFDFDRKPQEVKRALIDRPKAEVVGTVVEVPVGFDLQGDITGHRGYPSIFLMHGTPEIEPDRNLYNVFFSARTKREITDKQIEIFNQKMAERNG